MIVHCLKSFKPPLLLKYITGQVRYLPLKNKFLQENIFYRKNNFPIGQFPTVIKKTLS